MLISELAIDAVSESLVSSDFHSPANAIIYDAIVTLRAQGELSDAVTVVHAIEKSGLLDMIGDPARFIALQANVPNHTAVRHYAKIVMDHALRRRMIGEAGKLAAEAYDLTSDPGAALEMHQATIANMGTTIIDREPDDWAIEDFINRPRNQVERWVVHGLIRRRHKVMLVGTEGAGKSWICRYVGLCAAYGIQPFRHTRQTPVRVLIIDLENPEDALYDSFETILRQVTAVSDVQNATSRLWWRPDGLNLRNRGDVAQLENIIRQRRPDLVCVGPLYASYIAGGGDFGWETAPTEVQAVWKKLMVRYDFGVLFEDHAPQPAAGHKRDMRPYGSVRWRQWPDIGMGLNAVEGREGAFTISHWRGSRVATDWPTHIEQGRLTNSPWPFVVNWDPIQ